MKTSGKIGFAALGLAFALQTPAAAQEKANVIVPGQRIGHVAIGASEKTLNALGKPNYQDGKAQSQWRTWFTKPSANAPDMAPAELDVCAEARSETGGARVIQVVRVTSSYFTLASGIKAGSSFARVKRAYPRLKRIAIYSTRRSNGPIFLYDAIKQGIAFEFYRGRDGKAPNSLCVAIAVHNPLIGVNDYMTRMTDHVSEAIAEQR